MESLIGEYGWLFIAGIITLLFQSTIQEAVDGIMVFLGNDYNEDDVKDLKKLVTELRVQVANKRDK